MSLYEWIRSRCDGSSNLAREIPVSLLVGHVKLVMVVLHLLPSIKSNWRRQTEKGKKKWWNLKNVYDGSVHLGASVLL